MLSIEFAIKNYIESWGSNLRRAKISKLELGPGVEDKQPAKGTRATEVWGTRLRSREVTDLQK